MSVRQLVTKYHILSNNCIRNYCLKINDKKNNNQYSNTVFVPKSNYQRKHSRSLELNSNEISFFNSLKSQNQSETQREFALHDGPPYANGSAHFGHAVNKILKDIICRRKSVEGLSVSFTPGWDCHGLPIELKAVSNDNSSLNPIEIRQKARQLALDVIEEQKKSFTNWGVLADWENPYLTFSPVYINNELKAFYKLLENNLVFRDYMPVYWSPSTRTALAEAELQYNDNHVSQSVYVKFKLLDIPKHIEHFGDIYALIWTTTPWTLPANEAIAYSKTENYAVVKVNQLSDDNFLVAKNLIQNLEKQFDSVIEIMHIINGSELSGVKYMKTIGPENESLPMLESQFVTMNKGTGLVHIAPNHGLDDYKLIMKHKISLKECMVDDRGCYIDNTNSSLRKKFVLSEGNESVIELLGDSVLYKHQYIHSYPYDWRTNKPVIVRASPQWFIDIESVRQNCIEVLENVKFFPDFYKSYMINELKIRPNWCISRQRSWGVPIPVFYKKDDENYVNPIITKHLSQHILKQFEEKGYDFWWESSVEQIVPNSLAASELNLNSTDLVKGRDIFDIWFDSGMSWKTALKEPKIADLYLEGVDQLRGWFQSSLILSVALRNCAPYKSVIIHGFALDKDGKKMSKSIGNVIDPNSVIENTKSPTNNCGVDGLRWWIASHASNHENVKVSLQTFDDTLNCINKIRNTIKFIIGSLNEFNPYEHSCDLNEMNIIDKYMLHLLHNYLNEIKFGYENFQFGYITRKSTHFLISQVSGFYCSRIKHRLYCYEKCSSSRRSAQTVLSYIYNTILHELSPILPNIMSDANNHLQIVNEFTSNKLNWNQELIEQNMKQILGINDIIGQQLIGKNTVQYDCYIRTLDDSCFRNLSLFQSDLSSSDSELCEILRMSTVTYGNSELPQIDGILLTKSLNNETPYELLLTSAKKHLCDRCRRYTSINRSQVCDQCLSVLSSFWS